MTINQTSKQDLSRYIKNNGMVYQVYDELIEVSNDTEKENQETLLGYFGGDNLVEVYTKHSRWAKDGWSKLSDWATGDDVLFLLDGVGVMICISKKEAVENNLVAE